MLSFISVGKFFKKIASAKKLYIKIIIKIISNIKKTDAVKKKVISEIDDNV
jgi:hypothetical protein